MYQGPSAQEKTKNSCTANRPLANIPDLLNPWHLHHPEDTYKMYVHNLFTFPEIERSKYASIIDSYNQLYFCM
jgi:hypothetical protein